MREIKFRAWDKEEKKMKRVFALDFSQWWVATNYSYTREGERNSFKNEETDRHILMQYTGLKDKNGKEIYEGDIVGFRTSWQHYRKAEVIYDKSAFTARGWHPNFWHSLTLDKIEIIGNIYENKELLEVSNVKQ